MNTKLKVAAGIFAGLIAGTTLMGTAIAAPGFRAGSTYGPGMMRQLASNTTTFTAPTWSGMLSFMNEYRTANGTVNVTRMRNDVASGKVTPPCIKGRTTARATSNTARAYRRGPAMMQGWTGTGSTGGYTMMGRSY